MRILTPYFSDNKKPTARRFTIISLCSLVLFALVSYWSVVTQSEMGILYHFSFGNMAIIAVSALFIITVNQFFLLRDLASWYYSLYLVLSICYFHYSVFTAEHNLKFVTHPKILTINQKKTMNPIKVALVEDNHYLREGLVQLINGTSGFKCVGAFPDASDIVHHIRCAAPHVVLMDIDLSSKINGIEATFLIKEALPDVFVLIQTVFEDKTKIFQAIKAGASGYLVKNTPPAKLLEAIQDVVAGGSPMTPSIAYKALEMFRQADIPTPYGKTPSVFGRLYHQSLQNNLIQTAEDENDILYIVHFS